jgi:carboxyl-terminal processing protease
MELNRLMRIVRVFAFPLVLSLLIYSSRGQQEQPKIGKFERDEVLQMLSTIADDVKKHYYDPKLRGIDWEANVKSFRERIDNAASLNRGLSEVAAALDVLNDSHTFFLPPPRPYKHDYGWRIQMIGQECYVTGVRPESDAEKKGVKRGDEVLAINGFVPTRDNLWKMNFVHNVLRPQPSLRISLLSPNGEKKDVEIEAKIRQLPPTKDLTGGGIWEYVRELETAEALGRFRYYKLEGGVMILKFPAFVFTPGQVDEVMKKARDDQAFILDLRGNGGGSVETLKEFLSNFFDQEVRICDRVTRDGAKPMLAKAGGKDAFKGKLIVLVDSGSGSASEILARVVQLEKRGTLIGDRSAGAVMEARRYQYTIGFDRVLFYGASITDADLVMKDGKSLEKVGVIPDEVLIPTGADLAAGRDPVMARAVELAGGKITPEAAAKLFPFEWPKE